MISVCIPVFNVDVRKLTETLAEQAAKLGYEGKTVEIILLDDGSDQRFREINRPLTTASGSMVNYHELEENIGRARIRNRFPEHAKYPHLLFLDCDLRILSDDFLSNYSEAIRQYPGRVIVGGCNYDPASPPLNYRLHWTYGIRRESRPAAIRSLDPNRSFMTSNFIIPAGLMKEIRFDERLNGYGHEDSLFGYELSRKGHEIIHIDNPVIHEGIETNREFTLKTAQAVKNLVYIKELTGNDPGFNDSVKLIRTAERLNSQGLGGLIQGMMLVLNPIIRCMLNNGCSSLKLLDTFKLGLFLRTEKNKTSHGNQGRSDHN